MNKDKLKALGSKKTVYETNYNPTLLESFASKHTKNDYRVELNANEFTCLCPITGQPDFAKIGIIYIPDKLLVESKSLKLYLFSFRNYGGFHEDCINLILSDLVALLSPKYIEVVGDFNSRGGIKITPTAVFAKKGSIYEDFAVERLVNE